MTSRAWCTSALWHYGYVTHWTVPSLTHSGEWTVQCMTDARLLLISNNLSFLSLCDKPLSAIHHWTICFWSVSLAESRLSLFHQFVVVQLVLGSWNSLLVVSDSWSKGSELESRQEGWDNFLLQSLLFVSTLIRCPFHPRITAVASKRPRSFCQKCRWQITTKTCVHP